MYSQKAHTALIFLSCKDFNNIVLQGACLPMGCEAFACEAFTLCTAKRRILLLVSLNPCFYWYLSKILTSRILTSPYSVGIAKISSIEHQAKGKKHTLLKSSIRLVVLRSKTKEQYAPFGCA